MKSLELLSPAGNLISAYAAINSGADAIYLGAPKFSARAFADNLSVADIITVIKYAHTHDVNVYLAINILVNESEFIEIPEILDPLYLAGLDGVIVQDIGVAEYIKCRYPMMELHGSTQMSIMNAEGAIRAKEFGFDRVVPARELTLEEVADICGTGVSVECFIHGAMCYSYSGLCLMSSIIGGRSGNRGKCAGTCRLPFDYGMVSNHDIEYPISMKDMCTIEILPLLIEAGIYSFKIEGRMKSPEYVAGVTAMYRKYINLYQKVGKAGYVVDKKDLNILRKLYIRSEISEGYYKGYKGKNLITAKNPGYNGNDEEYITYLNSKYVHEPDKTKIDMYFHMHIGSRIGLSISCGDIYTYLEGDFCELANNAPLLETRVSKQLAKLGDTPFILENLVIDMDENAFIPLSKINELRRDAIDLFIVDYLNDKGYLKRDSVVDNARTVSSNRPKNGFEYEIQIKTKEHLKALIDSQWNGVVFVDYSLFENSESINILINRCSRVVLVMPHIYRMINRAVFGRISEYIKNYNIKYCLCNTYDEIGFVCDNFSDVGIYTSPHIYNHNVISVHGLASICEHRISGITYPYELTLSEYHALSDGAFNTTTSLTVYGYIPLMITNNCLKKTYDICDHKQGLMDTSINDQSVGSVLIDRYNHRFPVVTECSICTNIIYNDRPLNLYRMLDKCISLNTNFLRINLTIENYEDSLKIIRGFVYSDTKGVEYIKSIESTTGHMKRGV